MTNANAITIGHTTKLNIIIYKDEPVLTFKMVDEAHVKTTETAKVNFNRNKKRFIEGKHYHMVQYAEAEALKPYDVDVPPRGLTLITKRGYLLLVKSFTDDLAWEVQEQLVDHYFEGQIQAMSVVGEPELITMTQYYELKRRIEMIASGFHMKESVKDKLANLVRFHLNIGGLRDVLATDYHKAIAILEDADRQSNEILSMRIEQEKLIIDEYVCAGIPFTGTLRKEFVKQFQLRLPKAPNWRDVVKQLEAPDDDGPEPLPQ